MDPASSSANATPGRAAWIRRWPFFAVPFAIAGGIAISLAVVAAQAGNGTPGIEEGLSDAQRLALHKELRKTATAQSAQIVQDFLSSGLRVSGLRQVGSFVEYDASPLALEEAQERAVFVVHGRIDEQYVEVNPAYPSRARVVSKISVLGWFKGATSELVMEIEQEGTPTLDDGEFVLRVFDFDPVVRLGAEVVLFAESRNDNGGRITALPFSTIEFSDSGVIEVNELNSDLASLSGVTLEVLKVRLGGYAVAQ